MALAARDAVSFYEVEVQALDAARLEPLIGTERMARFEQTAEAARETLAGASVLNVNSTASGGGVAEMLQTLLSYARGAGIDARWLVIQGDPAFFTITKRVHNGLYGSPGDGRDLGPEEHRHYEQVLRANAHELLALLREMVDNDSLTILMVTHDRELATSFSDRIILMKDGRVVEG